MADTRISNNNNTSTTAVVLSDEDDMWNDELMEKYAQQMEEYNGIFLAVRGR
jgi:hypothetical protein